VSRFEEKQLYYTHIDIHIKKPLAMFTLKIFDRITRGNQPQNIFKKKKNRVQTS